MNGTQMFDLLTAEEHAIDVQTRELCFDNDLLSERMVATVDWLGGSQFLAIEHAGIVLRKLEIVTGTLYPFVVSTGIVIVEMPDSQFGTQKGSKRLVEVHQGARWIVIGKLPVGLEYHFANVRCSGVFTLQCQKGQFIGWIQDA